MQKLKSICSLVFMHVHARDPQMQTLWHPHPSASTTVKQQAFVDGRYPVLLTTMSAKYSSLLSHATIHSKHSILNTTQSVY